MAAVIAPSKLVDEARFMLVEWTPLANGDSGGALYLGDFNDITYRVYGTLGAGGTVTILGSLNKAGETADAGAVLEEEAGIALTLNAASPWATARNAPLTTWPSVTNGDGTTSVTVRAVCRR